MTFVINGKFTAQRITGVQRVASELVEALAAQAAAAQALAALAPAAATAAHADAADTGFELAVPPDARAAPTAQQRRRVCGSLTGNLWEQWSLPRATRAELLVSLCNTGPWFKRRHVVMMHDMAVYDTAHAFTRTFRLWYRLAFALLSRRARHILTVSEFSKQRIVHRLGVPAARVSVIRPAVDHLGRIASDPGILAKLDLQPHSYCLMVGSQDPRKNLARALAAFAQARLPEGVRCVLAGGANQRIFGRDGAHAALAQAADAARVVAAGFVSDGELKALYENAACFVFPSLYEGFGLPPLEAMYCGCPVIVSREASLPEVCGAAALYCDAHSVADIAAKITLLLGDPELRERHRQLGLAQARTHDWRAAAGQLRAVLAALPRRGAADGPARAAAAGDSAAAQAQAQAGSSPD
jgi:glycosyltransferase involved in cell wall biosynthesis